MPDTSTYGWFVVAGVLITSCGTGYIGDVPSLEGGAPLATCGDQECSQGEDCATCPQDCGNCGDACGDQECSGGEDCASCPEDCGGCGETCGDGTLDPGETCDPPESCPSSCDDGDACTADSYSGSAASCDLSCTSTPITACVSGDGCCPAGCTISSDDDCVPDERTLFVASGSASAGETVDVTLALSDGDGVGGLQMVLSYDPSVLSIPDTDDDGDLDDEIVRGALLTDHLLVANAAVAGEVRVVVASSNSMSAGSGAVVVIPFEVAGSAGSGEQALTLTGVFASDVLGEELAVAVVSGALSLD